MTHALMWFRRDLRLQDNPALYHAACHQKLLCIYIDCEQDNGQASDVFLHHSLASLDHSLQQTLGCPLHYYQGNPAEILQRLIDNHQLTHVYWNRVYEPVSIARDTALKKTLKSQGIGCETFNASLLFEPATVVKADQTPYKVFTPFYRAACALQSPPLPHQDIPKKILSLQDTSGLSLAALQKIPSQPWHQDVTAHWDISEQGAHNRLRHFLHNGLVGYKEKRNYPAQDHTSRLSPYLHFGQLSPHQVWHQALEISNVPPEDLAHFHSELGWREFSSYLLYHFPTLPNENFQKKFNGFPWVQNDVDLSKWQKGQTGFPIVDAGMRELWQTGYMHNRVRMIVASFLVKNLLIDWRLGAKWFWDCLVDGDLASNSASWQWVAGSGADAAPYFRIFNTTTQGEKFDPNGDYIKRYVPELRKLTAPHLFAPWTAPTVVLQQAGITLGVTYPKPMVDLAHSRDKALAAFRGLSGESIISI